jgi:hypothetical protein
MIRLGTMLTKIIKRLAQEMRTRPDPSAFGATGLDL